MGHLHTDMTVRGSKADVELKNVLIDTGATYTVLPKKVLEGVGAWGPVGEVEVHPTQRPGIFLFVLTISCEEFVYTVSLSTMVIGISGTETLCHPPLRAGARSSG